MVEILLRGRWWDTGRVIPDFMEYRLSSVNEAVFIVERFTGLTDKNGIKLFDGDIMQYGDGYPTGGGDWDEFTNRGEVVWDEERAGWNVTNKNQIDFEDFLSNDDYEVIGNIHENPEMLERDDNGAWKGKIADK